jgi:hypothetical protein
MKTSRRNFLIGLSGAGAMLACGALRQRIPTPLPTDVPLVDFHAHLFGVGDSNSGCHLHQKQRKHWTFNYLKRLLEIEDPTKPGYETIDEQLVRRLVQHVRASSVDKVLLQSWDGRYTNGKLDLVATTSLYVPNEYLFRVVRQYRTGRSSALDSIGKTAKSRALIRSLAKRSKRPDVESRLKLNCR